jgi:hypothetical protein
MYVNGQAMPQAGISQHSTKWIMEDFCSGILENADGINVKSPTMPAEGGLEEGHDIKPVGTKRPMPALAPDRSWAPRRP